MMIRVEDTVTIRQPSMLIIDNTVSCRVDGENLRCTARRPAAAAVSAKEKEKAK